MEVAAKVAVLITIDNVDIITEASWKPHANAFAVKGAMQIVLSANDQDHSSLWAKQVEEALGLLLGLNGARWEANGQGFLGDSNTKSAFSISSLADKTVQGLPDSFFAPAPGAKPGVSEIVFDGHSDFICAVTDVRPAADTEMQNVWVCFEEVPLQQGRKAFGVTGVDIADHERYSSTSKGLAFFSANVIDISDETAELIYEVADLADPEMLF